MSQEFNIFEALGISRAELRHSNFLAFLLSPNQNHRLGHLFLKSFLQMIFAHAPETSAGTNLPNVDSLALAEMIVIREWRNIDILLLHDRHKLAIIVENKIGTGEHSNQLQRYQQTVADFYPGYAVLGVFLTPYGDKPSDERYQVVTYAQISSILEQFLADEELELAPTLRTLLTHYVKVIKTKVIGNPEFARLRQRNYQEYQKRVNAIYVSSTDLRSQISHFLQELIQSTPGLNLDRPDRDYVRFAPAEWDIPFLMRWEPRGWTHTRRNLLFEFQIIPQSPKPPTGLLLKLTLGPPPPEASRQTIVSMARSHPHIFIVEFTQPRHGPEFPQWYRLYKRSILDIGSLLNDIDTIRGDIQAMWMDFVTGDLVTIRAIIRNQDWFLEQE